MPRLNNYPRDVGFGSGNDRTRWDNYGQRKAYGRAVGYEDLSTSLKGKRLSTTTGKVEWDWDRHACKFEPAGDITVKADKVGDEHQYPHSAKEDGAFYYHMHWFQTEDWAQYGGVEFVFRYRVNSNGSEEVTDWTTVTVTPNEINSVFEYNGETSLVQITRLATVDLTGTSISAMVDWEMARTDDSGMGNIYIKYIDPHYIQDTDGSDTEYVKNEDV